MSEHIVTLTNGEIVAASAVGMQRQRDAISRGMVDPRAINDAVRYRQWSGHIEGAMAELAVCKLLGVHWTASCNTLKREADIPPDIEVRSRSGGDGPYDRHLILRPNDAPTRVFVLVTGVAPTYTIIGAIRACDGQQQRWWADHNGWGRPAFWVPPANIPPLNIEGMRQHLFAYFAQNP